MMKPCKVTLTDLKYDKSVTFNGETYLINDECKKVHTCYICRATFSLLSDLVIHKQLHCENENDIDYDFFEENYVSKSKGNSASLSIEKIKSLDVLRRVNEKTPSPTKPKETSLKENETKTSSQPNNEVNPPFRCIVCDVCFKTSDAAKRHTPKVTKRKCKFSCHLCNRNFNTLYAFVVHVMQHNPNLSPSGSMYACSTCDKHFKYCFQLRRHERTMHNNVKNCFQLRRDDRTMHKKETSSQLSSPTATLQPTGITEPQRTDVAEQKETEFTCELCYDVFNTKDELDGHTDFHKQLEGISEAVIVHDTEATVEIIDDYRDRHSTVTTIQKAKHNSSCTKINTTTFTYDTFSLAPLTTSGLPKRKSTAKLKEMTTSSTDNKQKPTKTIFLPKIQPKFKPGSKQLENTSKAVTADDTEDSVEIIEDFPEKHATETTIQKSKPISSFTKTNSATQTYDKSSSAPLPKSGPPKQNLTTKIKKMMASSTDNKQKPTKTIFLPNNQPKIQIKPLPKKQVMKTVPKKQVMIKQPRQIQPKPTGLEIQSTSPTTPKEGNDQNPSMSKDVPPCSLSPVRLPCSLPPVSLPCSLPPVQPITTNYVSAQPTVVSQGVGGSNSTENNSTLFQNSLLNSFLDSGSSSQSNTFIVCSSAPVNSTNTAFAANMNSIDNKQQPTKTLFVPNIQPKTKMKPKPKKPVRKIQLRKILQKPPSLEIHRESLTSFSVVYEGGNDQNHSTSENVPSSCLPSVQPITSNFGVSAQPTVVSQGVGGSNNVENNSALFQNSLLNSFLDSGPSSQRNAFIVCSSAPVNSTNTALATNMNYTSVPVPLIANPGSSHQNPLLMNTPSYAYVVIPNSMSSVTTTSPISSNSSNIDSIHPGVSNPISNHLTQTISTNPIPEQQLVLSQAPGNDSVSCGMTLPLIYNVMSLKESTTTEAVSTAQSTTTSSTVVEAALSGSTTTIIAPVSSKMSNVLLSKPLDPNEIICLDSDSEPEEPVGKKGEAVPHNESDEGGNLVIDDTANGSGREYNGESHMNDRKGENTELTSIAESLDVAECDEKRTEWKEIDSDDVKEDRKKLKFPIKCDTCNVMFQRNRAMRNHFGRKVPCDKCEFKCCRMIDLKNHYMSMHKIFYCWRCKFQAQSQTEFDSHRESHTCRSCKGVYAVLKNHNCKKGKQNEDTRSEATKKWKSRPTEYRCVICFQNFYSSEEFIQHRAEHTVASKDGDSSNLIIDSDDEENNPKPSELHDSDTISIPSDDLSKMIDGAADVEQDPLSISIFPDNSTEHDTIVIDEDDVFYEYDEDVPSPVHFLPFEQSIDAPSNEINPLDPSDNKDDEVRELESLLISSGESSNDQSDIASYDFNCEICSDIFCTKEELESHAEIHVYISENTREKQNTSEEIIQSSSSSPPKTSTESIPAHSESSEVSTTTVYCTGPESPGAGISKIQNFVGVSPLK
ncbi:hypothetical protein JTB14_006880 [Gonioctena quinquepunctata]|nr:hypothetical protein JTB14_006880 [Gonioctena quinquepunctata]